MGEEIKEVEVSQPLVIAKAEPKQLNNLAETNNIKPINNSSVSESTISNTLGVSGNKSLDESKKVEVKQKVEAKAEKSPTTNEKKESSNDSNEETKVTALSYFRQAHLFQENLRLQRN